MICLINISAIWRMKVLGWLGSQLTTDVKGPAQRRPDCFRSLFFRQGHVESKSNQ